MGAAKQIAYFPGQFLNEISEAAIA